MKGRALRGMRVVAGALIAAALAACAPLGVVGEPDPATAAIWDTRTGRPVAESVLVARLAAARLRLLGEIHDNPEHHAIRARLVTAIAAAGRRPAVVMEQFDLTREEALAKAQRDGADAEAVAAAGGLDRRAWGWPLHKPVVEAALAARLPIHAGNVSRVQLAALSRTGGGASLDARWQKRIDVAAWTDARSGALREEILRSHCGKLPESLVPRLAFAQRVRDAAMAEALAAGAGPDGAILIAGNGHVRKERGVPDYLREVPPDERISVGFVEATPEELTRRAGVVRAVASEFDYVWLTSRVARADPCASMPEIRPAAPAAGNDRSTGGRG